MHKAAIIIVNFNTHTLTLNTLHSLMHHCDLSQCQIIVVDNGSEVDDYLALKKQIETIQTPIELYRNRINTGFSGGNMFGVQFAQADHYVFLNSDVLFENDCITPMITYLKNHPKVSVVGCQSKDEKGVFYKSFDYKISFINEILPNSIVHKINPNRFLNRKKQFVTPTKVDAVPGSLFVVNAKDFDELGGLDTNIFLYYEEKDFAYRVQKKLQKEIHSLPNLCYIHLKGKSTKPSVAIRNELKLSHFYIVRKNLSLIEYLLFYLYHLVYFSLKGWFSAKNRSFLKLLYTGMSMQNSLKLKQKIHKI